jgi:putative flippase GtrA
MRALIRFLLTNDLRTILAALHSRDVHPVIQFFKYAVCGVAALAVHTTIFFLLAKWVLPALKSNVSDDSVRADHALINVSIAFLFSNATAYWLNVRWVFTSGRHSRVKEFLFFTLVNGPGAISGVAVQDWLIRSLSWPAWAAFAGFVLPNVLVNFACRKLFIFQR